MKQNFKFEKRQRDLEKKKKKAAKAERKEPATGAPLAADAVLPEKK
jgi:hypothetical protein